ncbi:MAG: hypothetical protein ACTSUO_03995 [Candidatus Thorarchaeota archaeon]
MSIAKKAVDSTVKKILVYTAEIIASFILLVIICLPLAFTIPMWLQKVIFGSTTANYLINPVAWFGVGGAVGATILLAIPSLIFGYLTVMKMTSRETDSDDADESDAKEETEDKEEEEEEPEEEKVEAESDEVEESSVDSDETED